jgi:methyl-accepting chemotaxis protein
MKRFKDLRIATKLIILFLAVGVTLTLGAGYLVMRISTQNLISQIKEKYLMEASDYMTAIDIIMDKNYHQIQSFAQSEIFTPGTSTPEEMTEFLKKRKEIYGYAWLSYYDMQRIKIADTDEEELGKQEEAVGFWKEVLNGKVSAGSDVRMCEGSKALEINFAAPVKNKGGKAIGVVVARYSAEDINQIVEDIKEESSHVVLIDRDRNILFTNCEVLKELVLKEKLSGLPSVKSALAGQKGVILEYSPYHKKEYFTAYVHEKGWHNFKGNDWSLLVSLEKDKALAPIQPLRNGIVGVLILTALEILIIGPLIARSITKPIVELNKVAQKIKEGELTQRAEVTAYDEVGELAMVFN